MPRIKYSTLLTALAGKSGGSVFAKNRGGYYFRNNKSGYKLKSLAQSLSQGKFKSVSSLWRDLSDSDRLAWNTQATSIPSTDIFGDPKPLNGYEFFMKINGTLATRGLPTVIVPPVPRSIPEYEQPVWFSPDAYMYQPLVGIRPKNLQTIPSTVIYKSLGVTGGLQVNKYWSVLLYFDLADKVKDLNRVFGSITTKFEDSNLGYELLIELSSDGLGNYTIVVYTLADTWTLMNQYTIDIATLGSSLSLMVQQNAVNADEYDLFVDGEFLSPDTSTSSGVFVPMNFDLLFVEYLSNFVDTQISLCDLRYINDRVEGSDLIAATAGYLTGGEDVILQMPTSSNGKIAVFGQTNFTGYLVPLNNSVPVTTENAVSKLSFLRTPLIYILSQIKDSSNWVVDIHCSAPTSPGRNYSSVNYKKVFENPMNTFSLKNITTEVRESYPYITGGSTLKFMYSLIDISTGFQYQKEPVKNNGNVHRFKAGSELANRVKVP